MTCVDKVNNFSFFPTSCFYIIYHMVSQSTYSFLKVIHCYRKYTHNAVLMLFEILFNNRLIHSSRDHGLKSYLLTFFKSCINM